MSSETFPRPGKAVTSDEFRRACSRFVSGVTVATVLDAKGAPHGLTVSSFTSVSLHPPLVLICLGHGVATIEHFRAAKHFGINILAENQQALSDRFARKGHDRFGGLEWRPGVTGVPLIPGVLGAIECAVYSRVAMGDHDILVGEMVRTHATNETPLVYFAGEYRKLEAL
jgi:flavin reductase (DIM6/NTAB) family NADH-FMN oxidoreductase RutF